jgi:hypothetical protein
MRSALAALTFIVVLFAAGSALAERRMFIIANNADGGIDRCLASGAKCGAAAAQAYCKSREFAQANSFRKVDRDDITGAIPTTGVSGACHGASCDEFVAIECTR